MNKAVRVLTVLFVVPATTFFVYWLPFSLIPLGNQIWIATLVSLMCAAAAGWYVWKITGSGPGNFISSILYGAVLVGGIAFSIGFFGPMIFAPGANQGPLLGILITGPLGFLAGGGGGFFYWLIYGRKPVYHQVN